MPEGRVEVSWVVEDRGAERYLLLDWAELGGPEVQRPERRGFGSTLLEQGMIFTLGGTVDLRFPPEGVRCRIELPLSVNPELQPNLRLNSSAWCIAPTSGG